MRSIPKAAVDLVARWEGCKLKAYRDVVGVWTIGYGHIEGVKPGDTVTKEEARALLAEDLKDAAHKLYGVLKAQIIDELTDNQWAALLSFVFNLGAGKKWTIWKRLNARQFDQVPVEMMKFVNAGGRKIQGLVNRRADEVKLFVKNEPGIKLAEPPSHVTRSTATPPTPADPVPPQKSATFISAALGTAATVPVAATQVTQAIEPYKDSSPLVGQMVAGVATIAAIAAIIVLVLTWLNKRKARS